MIYTCKYKSPLGEILLAADEIGLTGLWFEGQKYYMDKIIEDFEEKKNLPVLDQAEYWLDRYFAGQDPDPEELPLAPAGSDFRKEVWKIITKIPYGCTITYGKIAKILAVKRGAKSISPQAVGGAVGHNPISVIIPCHRVIGSDGSLTGYAGGIHKKGQLLELERADMRRFFLPEKGTAL